MLRPSIRRVTVAFLLALSAAPLSCGGLPEGGEDGAEESVDSDSSAVVSVPPRGTLQTLDIAEWNVEWFGSTGYGPTNETLQLENVRDVIKGTDFDIWALEEIVSASQWSSLQSQLPGYAGLLANDPIVTQGSSYYATGEQKVGILYKTDVATVQSAKLILTNQDTNFAGRPPLEVKLTVSVNGSTVSLVLIVFHAKATSDADSYAKRKAGATALKAYLDSTYPTERVIVAGDYNDDLDVSIAGGQASPYKSLVDDTADYMFPTKAFTDAGLGTTTSSSTAIDHQMVTNELVPLYVAGSAEVYKVNAYVPQYSSTTSDHYPTLTRYSLGTAAAPKLILNEICANEPGSATTGEFVEIVNVGSGTADLSGFGVYDATGVRHLFPGGAALAPGKSMAVFGGAAGVPAGLGNAVAASTGALNLANGGDTVMLKDGAGAVVDSFTYASSLASVDGVSMNRSPDATAAGVFALHTTIVAASASPGKRASGSDF